MAAIACTESGKELVTWEVALTMKAPGEEERVVSGLQQFGQACIMDKRFGTINYVVVRGQSNIYFFITTDHDHETNRRQDIKRRLESMALQTITNLATSLQSTRSFTSQRRLRSA